MAKDTELTRLERLYEVDKSGLIFFGKVAIPYR